MRTAEPKSELTVVMKAKDLCAYVMNVTQKSPKQFRFTYIGRMQNLSIDIIDQIYRANETYIGGKEGMTQIGKRLNHQHGALTDIKILAFIAQLAMEQRCILPKQYEQIAEKATDCQYLLAAWINSDKKRFPSQSAGASPSQSAEM
jgi:hypothetical protein